MGSSLLVCGWFGQGNCGPFEGGWLKGGGGIWKRFLPLRETQKEMFLEHLFLGTWNIAVSGMCLWSHCSRIATSWRMKPRVEESSPGSITQKSTGTWRVVPGLHPPGASLFYDTVHCHLA